MVCLISTVKLYVIVSLSYVCLSPLQKLTDSADDNGDGDDVVAKNLKLSPPPSPACRCTTTGGSGLPALSAQEYLFICLSFRSENKSFFIFSDMARVNK